MKGKIYTEYRSRNVANDTYAVTLEQSEGEVIPLDDMQFERRGNAIKVRGRWSDVGAADTEAKRIFEKAYGPIDWR